ncbi:hypothetical protein NIE88_07345 [Sporolactobacillus shoreicorticis]|uniref:YwgA family protein n=1 Tax=Sporolactobacillus shoreicorticis TaxID=1923877 RepID=A0ABW5S8I1_9BACL|nr:hypothetical protein [Sporolactobacillus shoreicorticis]MCO7125584.1 hypothetical protein [Sporolactobacillus shoreicorticis]
MLEDHAKIAALINQTGGISGRKKLQKAVYIFQRLGYPFEQIFHFHFNGPYSEELSIQLEELCDFGFLIEDREDHNEEEETCYYRISEAGQGFLTHYKNVLPTACRLTQQIMNQNALFLESVAILLYFDHLPRIKAVEKARTLNKETVGDNLEHALAFIDKIRLLQSIELSISQ